MESSGTRAGRARTLFRLFMRQNRGKLKALVPCLFNAYILSGLLILTKDGKAGRRLSVTVAVDEKRRRGYENSVLWRFQHLGLYARQRHPDSGALAQELPEAEIIEEGLNGRNSIFRDVFVPEKCGFDTFKTLLMSHKPLDLVIIMLGTNDLKSVYHASASYLAKGMEAYLQTVRNPALWKDTPMPAVLVVSPILLGKGLVEEDREAFDERSLRESGRLARFYEEVARQYGAAFLNAAEYAKASDIDHLHMNPENHRKLGLAIAGRVRELFFASPEKSLAENSR